MEAELVIELPNLAAPRKAGDESLVAVDEKYEPRVGALSVGDPLRRDVAHLAVLETSPQHAEESVVGVVQSLLGRHHYFASTLGPVEVTPEQFSHEIFPRRRAERRMLRRILGGLLVGVVGPNEPAAGDLPDVELVDVAAEALQLYLVASPGRGDNGAVFVAADRIRAREGQLAEVGMRPQEGVQGRADLRRVTSDGAALHPLLERLDRALGAAEENLEPPRKIGAYLVLELVGGE